MCDLAFDRQSWLTQAHTQTHITPVTHIAHTRTHTSLESRLFCSTMCASSSQPVCLSTTTSTHTNPTSTRSHMRLAIVCSLRESERFSTDAVRVRIHREFAPSQLTSPRINRVHVRRCVPPCPWLTGGWDDFIRYQSARTTSSTLFVYVLPVFFAQ